jgi:molybdenum cofactor cytidylyltransferase
MGRPKALLAIDGQTFVDRLVTLLQVNCDEVIVVLGYGADGIRNSMQSKATAVVNPDPSRGQLSSMQCGLRALPNGCEAFLFTPVDYPAVNQRTIASIVATAEENVDWDMVIPTFEGRRGHPVMCRAALAQEFLELNEQGSAKEVVHRHLDRAICVEVDDPATVQDIDDPAAYERLLASRI